MKKIVSIIIGLLLSVQFIGCAKSDQAPTPIDSTPPQQDAGADATSSEIREQMTENGKTILRVGSFSNGGYIFEESFSWLESAVRTFNAVDPNYEVQIIDYGDASASESAYRLNAEIIAGQAPDILITHGMPSARFASLGLFYDVNSWLDPAEFFTGPLDAMRTNGKLYEVSPAITGTTFYGLKSNITASENMPIDDIISAWERFNNGDKAFIRSFTNEFICQLLTTTSISRFVDEDSATCNFDIPEFISLLEFCAKLPKNPPTTKNEDLDPGIQGSPEMLFVASVKENDALLGMLTTSTNAGTPYVSHANIITELGNDIAYIGIPGANSAAYSMDFPIAVMENSANHNGAKAFIDSLWKIEFTSIRQRDLRRIPLKRSVLIEYAQSRIDEYIIDGLLDADGFAYDADGNAYANTLLYYPGPIQYTAMTGTVPYTLNEFEDLINLIDSSDLRLRIQVGQYGDWDTVSINPIIASEIQAFFAGTQDAKRTAQLIQSRYSIYLAEQN